MSNANNKVVLTNLAALGSSGQISLRFRKRERATIIKIVFISPVRAHE